MDRILVLNYILWKKVLDDILIEMFNEKFLEETFQCDNLPNHLTLKKLLTKLVHCSIMKLNESSMDKLFDLIIMVFKYQLSACVHSTDLIQITLNHLHSVSEITDKQPIKLLISLARNKFLSGPASSHAFKIQFTRQTLLNYLIGMKIRVSVLLKIGAQLEDGRFRHSNTGKVACHCQLPGKITQFDSKGQVTSVINFPTKGHFELDQSLTTLGFNIYEKEEELSKKFNNELSEKNIRKEVDENNNISSNRNQTYQSSQFLKEAQLLAVILGRENKEYNRDKNIENETEIELKENNSIKKKDSKFWLNIDLELDEADKDNENNKDEKSGELEKLEQAFGHQKLDNKESQNLSKVNLLRIKQQLDFQNKSIESIQNETNLLDLLDSELSDQV